MIKLKLVRETPLKTDCTLGVLRLNDKAICCTLEPPWLDNKKGSSIPVGSYIVTRYRSPSKNPQLDYQVFLLHDVPGRDYIEIHIGNTVKDTKGCILVGRTYSTLNGQRALLHSTETMRRLLNDLPEEFYLEVI